MSMNTQQDAIELCAMDAFDCASECADGNCAAPLPLLVKHCRATDDQECATDQCATLASSCCALQDGNAAGVDAVCGDNAAICTDCDTGMAPTSAGVLYLSPLAVMAVATYQS